MFFFRWTFNYNVEKKTWMDGWWWHTDNLDRSNTGKKTHTHTHNFTMFIKSCRFIAASFIFVCYVWNLFLQPNWSLKSFIDIVLCRYICVASMMIIITSVFSPFFSFCFVNEWKKNNVRLMQSVIWLNGWVSKMRWWWWMAMKMKWKPDLNRYRMNGQWKNNDILFFPRYKSDRIEKFGVLNFFFLNFQTT